MLVGVIVLVESGDPTGSSTPYFGEGTRAAHYDSRWHKLGRIEVEHREYFQPQWPVGCYSVLIPCEAQLTDVTARREAFRDSTEAEVDRHGGVHPVLCTDKADEPPTS